MAATKRAGKSIRVQDSSAMTQAMSDASREEKHLVQLVFEELPTP